MDIKLNGKQQYTLKNSLYFMMKQSPMFFWSFLCLNFIFVFRIYDILYTKTFVSVGVVLIRLAAVIFFGSFLGILPCISLLCVHYYMFYSIRRIEANIVFPSNLVIHYDPYEIQIQTESSVFHLSKEELFLKRKIKYKVTKRGIYFYIDSNCFFCFIDKKEREYVHFIQMLNKMKEGVSDEG